MSYLVLWKELRLLPSFPGSHESERDPEVPICPTEMEGTHGAGRKFAGGVGAWEVGG